MSNQKQIYKYIYSMIVILLLNSFNVAHSITQAEFDAIYREGLEAYENQVENARRKIRKRQRIERQEQERQRYRESPEGKRELARIKKERELDKRGELYGASLFFNTIGAIILYFLLSFIYNLASIRYSFNRNSVRAMLFYGGGSYYIIITIIDIGILLMYSRWYSTYNPGYVFFVLPLVAMLTFFLSNKLVRASVYIETDDINELRAYAINERKEELESERHVDELWKKIAEKNAYDKLTDKEKRSKKLCESLNKQKESIKNAIVNGKNLSDHPSIIVKDDNTVEINIKISGKYVVNQDSAVRISIQVESPPNLEYVQVLLDDICRYYQSYDDSSSEHKQYHELFKDIYEHVENNMKI